MKNKVLQGLCLLACTFIFALPVWAEEISNQDLQYELRKTQEKVKTLEKILQERIEPAKFEGEVKEREQDLHDRVSKIEKTMESSEEGGLLDSLAERITIGGLIEVGAVYASIENDDGSDEYDSDICLTTVELDLGIKVNEWVKADFVLLYEDPSFGEETRFDVDEGTITIGSTDQYPAYIAAGKMYVPFGAQLTHFPDDPLIDQPLTLAFGETSEKALRIGFERDGLACSAYAFNGDLDEAGSDDAIESYGFDVNYTLDDEALPYGMSVGASYISNVAESDGLTDGLGVDEIDDYVGGAAAYGHLDIYDFFLDAEFMTALNHFERGELAVGNGDGAKPSVWNIEAGYNWNWGKNLEIVLKYAGSDEAEGLGYPEDRYGINFNQEIFKGVIGSVGYIHDEFDRNDIDNRDDRDLLFSQIAVEF